MPNTCVAFGCKTNYATCKEKMYTFKFPNEEEYPELQKAWIKFVNRPEENWTPSKHSRLCALHFEDNYVKEGKVRAHLRWELNPIPTRHSSKVLERPSLIPTTSAPRKPPKVRVYQEDQMAEFVQNDIIHSLDNLTEQHCPPGYQYRRNKDCVIYYELKFDVVTSFPKVFGCIRIDKDLHV